MAVFYRKRLTVLTIPCVIPAKAGIQHEIF